MSRLPSFAIERLGPSTHLSPLHVVHGAKPELFTPDDARTLYDTTGYGWRHCEMPEDIEPVNMEVAGPRLNVFFRPEETRAAIVTCGGVCPGLNNVIRGLTRSLCVLYGIKEVLGIRYGYAGLVPGGHEPVPLTPQSVDRIHDLGGTILGSSRGPQPLEAMLAFLQARGINLLFTIGGDGTQRGAMGLAQGALVRGLKIAVVGIPKTIDNDLNYVDKTFGFETAFSIADGMLKCAHAEATSAFNGIGLVKLMGRESGYVTTLAALANGDVDFALIPEVPFQLEGPKGFLAALARRLGERGHAVVAVAEGAGQDLLAEEVARLGKDASGNQRLADVGLFLRQAVDTHFKSQNVPVNLRYIDPSYLVRSAPATPNDSVFCLQLAQNAAHAAMSGRTSMIVGTWKGTFTHVPMAAVVSERKRVDPRSSLWLTLLQATEQPGRMVND